MVVIRVMCGLVAALFLAAACSSKERPAYIDDSAAPGKGQAHAGKTGDSTGDGGGSPVGGNADTSGDEALGPGGVGNGSDRSSGSAFDAEPTQVYIVGRLRSHAEEAVFAPVETLSQYVYGFSAVHGAHTLWGSKLIYSRNIPYFAFVQDIAGAPVPEDFKIATKPLEDNDLRVQTPICDTDADPVESLQTSPDGRLIYHCTKDLRTYYEGSKVVYQGDAILKHLGYDDLTLVHGNSDTDYNWAAMKLGDGVPVPYPDIPLNVLKAARAHHGSFQVLVTADNLNTLAQDELWELDDAGGARTLGQFPPLPAGAAPVGLNASALTESGELYQAITVVKQNLLVKRVVGGDTTTIVQTETDESIVQCHGVPDGCDLFTGP